MIHTGVKKFEDERWQNKDQTLEFRHSACLEMVGDGAVLDLGCGDGLMLELFRNKGIIAVGLDFSDEAIKKCHSKKLEASAHDLDRPLPYKDSSFDSVVALDVLEHFYRPDLLIKEMARVAKKNVIIGIPNFSSLPARLQVLVGQVPENNRPNKGHVYWFNYLSLLRLNREVECKIVELKANTFRPCSWAGNIFSKLWPNLFALSFVAKLEKMP